MKASNRLMRLFVSVAMTAALCLTPATSAFASEEPGGMKTPQDDLQATQILVTLDNEASETLSLRSAEPSPAVQGLENAGMNVVDQAQLGDGEVLLQVEPAEGTTVDQAVEQARSLPGVASAQPNYEYFLIEGVEQDASSASRSAADTGGIIDPLASTGGATFPNDPAALVSDAKKSVNQYWLYNSKLVNAWNKAAASNEATVAVFDSGIQTTHEDLRTNILLDLAWDSYNNTPLDATAFTHGDNGGHGTHVSGTIAGVANNALGIAGASYNANILPVKVVNNEGTRKSSTLVLTRAYEYIFKQIDAGACKNLRVVNISMGGYSAASNDDALKKAITTARDKYGIVTVCAGGNGNSVTPRTDSLYPSDFEECVAVTALEVNGANIVWSDYNAAKDISAPGRSIYATTSNASAKGSYGKQSGTSMAAPVVAGTLALMFASAPQATVDQALEALYATAVPVIDSKNDRRATSGSHGALDASAAVSHLKRQVTKQAKTFSDVPEGEWFHNSVYDVVAEGMMSGYSDSTRFGSNELMLREQAAGILYNRFGNKAVKPAAPQADVSQSEWYTNAVNWAVSAGAMNGFNETEFGIGKPLTREQFASILANVAKVDTKDFSYTAFNALPDRKEVSEWAKESVAWAADRGLILGVEMPNGSRLINPQGTCTRAEVAAFSMRAIEQGII